MWVQSAGKKVSFCLIILARLAADTLASAPGGFPNLSAQCACRRNVIANAVTERSKFNINPMPRDTGGERVDSCLYWRRMLE